MNLSRSKMLKDFNTWLVAWNEHDLAGVMKLMHDDIVFENWNGAVVSGKNALQRAWAPWFMNHGNFRFTDEDVLIDEQEQKMTFSWCLEWPSVELFYKGRSEIRRGVDVLHFKDGKICKKYTYSKTNIHIDSVQVLMHVPENNFL